MEPFDKKNVVPTRETIMIACRKFLAFRSGAFSLQPLSFSRTPEPTLQLSNSVR